jgi:hypothetical protein
LKSAGSGWRLALRVIATAALALTGGLCGFGLSRLAGNEDPGLAYFIIVACTAVSVVGRGPACGVLLLVSSVAVFLGALRESSWGWWMPTTPLELETDDAMVAAAILSNLFLGGLAFAARHLRRTGMLEDVLAEPPLWLIAMLGAFVGCLSVTMVEGIGSGFFTWGVSMRDMTGGILFMIVGVVLILASPPPWWSRRHRRPSRMRTPEPEPA